MMDALSKAGISFESHIYAYGPHGFSLGDATIQSMDNGLCRRAPHWVKDSIACILIGPEGSCKVAEIKDKSKVPYITQSGEDRETGSLCVSAN